MQKFNRPKEDQKHVFPKNLDEFLSMIRKRESVFEVEQNFKDVVGQAAATPSSLYKFFYLYNVLNAGIASTIASLVGNIGKSRDIFINPLVPVRAAADYSFEVSELVNRASVNEYSDPVFGEISHRLLAMGVLESVGDLAKMSVTERNDVQTPVWLERLVVNIQTLYSGRQNDIIALARALGAHIFSEFSADELEFSNACKVLFIDHKNQGFHAYIKQEPLITIQDKTFRVDSWLRTHGGYDAEKEAIIHAAEFEHLAMGVNAVKLWLANVAPEDQNIILEAVFEGMTKMRTYLNAFFVCAQKEIASNIVVCSKVETVEERGVNVCHQ